MPVVSCVLATAKVVEPRSNEKINSFLLVTMFREKMEKVQDYIKETKKTQFAKRKKCLPIGLERISMQNL